MASTPQSSVGRVRTAVQSLVDRVLASPPGRVYRRFTEVDGPLLAIGIAFNAFFAMFPIMAAILSLIGFVLRDPALLASIQGAIIEVFPPSVSGEIADAVAGTTRAASLLGVISLIGLLWSGSALFGIIEKALARVYETSQRPFVQQKLIAFGMIFAFAILVVLTVSGSSIGAFAEGLLAQTPLAALPAVQFVVSLIPLFIAFGAGLALFLLIYRVYPAQEHTLQSVLPGSLFAATLFFLLSQLFPLYVRYAANFNAFGAFFGFFFLLLTWLYFVGQIVVLGAVVNATLRPGQPARREEPERVPPRRAA